MTPQNPSSGRVDAPESVIPTDPLGEAPTDPHADVAPLLADGAVDEAAPEPTMDTAPEREVAMQAARTDAALGAWRDESARRAQEFAVSQERLAVALAARRQRLVVSMALGAAGALVLLVFGAAIVGAGAMMQHPAPVRTVRAAPVAPEVVAAPEVVVAPEVVAAPAVVPAPEVVVAPEVVAAPAAVVAAPVPEIPAEDGPPVRSPRVRRISDWIWTSFATPSTGPVMLHWRDGARQPVLEPMGCGGTLEGGVRTCEAGRSKTRIDTALAAGAAPGRWTVEACIGGACTPVGDFAAPLTGP
jgi:hypothetical protein